jgi:hypothetical protein
MRRRLALGSKLVVLFLTTITVTACDPFLCVFALVVGDAEGIQSYCGDLGAFFSLFFPPSTVN